MRLVLALSIVAISAVSARAAEDRYGPPRAAAAAPAGPRVASALPASSSPYAGQMLSWGGKAPAQAPAATTASAAPTSPQPIAPWAGPAPTPRRAAYPSIAAPVQAATPAAYVPQTPAAAAQPLPTGLYDRPAAPAPVAGPQQPYQPPRTQAATLPPPPSTPTRLAAPDEARPRAYSVLREFGGTPDPIDIPPPTSYWATRPETAPPPEGSGEADADLGPAGGVGAADVASADSLSPEEEAAKRRKRELLKERAAAAEAGK